MMIKTKKGENNVGLNVDEEKISNDLALHILMLVDWLADPTLLKVLMSKTLSW